MKVPIKIMQTLIKKINEFRVDFVKNESEAEEESEKPVELLKVLGEEAGIQ